MNWLNDIVLVVLPLITSWVLLSLREMLRTRRSRGTATREEVKALHRQALETNIGLTNINELERESNAGQINKAASFRTRDIQLLRAYAANLPKHLAVSIDVTVYCLRLEMARGLTTLTPDALTAEHYAVAEELRDISMEREPSLVNVQPRSEVKYSLAEYERIVSYALENIDQGQLIVSLVRDRGMTDLESVKSMLKQMSEGSMSLAEGEL